MTELPAMGSECFPLAAEALSGALVETTFSQNALQEALPFNHVALKSSGHPWRLTATSQRNRRGAVPYLAI